MQLGLPAEKIDPRTSRLPTKNLDKFITSGKKCCDVLVLLQRECPPPGDLRQMHSRGGISRFHACETSENSLRLVQTKCDHCRTSLLQQFNPRRLRHKHGSGITDNGPGEIFRQ